MWKVIFGSFFKNHCTWEVKEGVNNLVSCLEEWRRCSGLDVRIALLLVMCYCNISMPQAQGSTSFCQHSADTKGRCQLLTWRSVFLLDSGNKTVGYKKMGLCKVAIIGEQNKQFSWLQLPWQQRKYRKRIEIWIWKRHNVALWILMGELCLGETSK